MQDVSLVTKFDRIVSGRNLIILVIADVVLFVVANVAYGPGHEHGVRMAVSNVAWVLFLIGFLLVVVFAVLNLAKAIRRRVRAQA